MNIIKNISDGYKKIATGIAIVSFLVIMYIALIPGGSVAQVINALSGEPIGNSHVRLLDYPEYTNMTDTLGNYRIENVPIGTYSVGASAPGYSLNISEVTVTDGGTTVNNFALSPTGLLRAVTNPAVPAQVYVDGIQRDVWGTNWVEIPVGTHTVSFGGYPNLIPPAPQVVTITAGGVTNVQGDYTGGMLRTVTNPAVPGTVFVDDIPRDEWGLNWLPLSAGSHTLSFGNVTGWRAPDPQTITITNGAVTTVTGNYVADPTAVPPDNVGLLRVTTNPAVPAQIYVDGIQRDVWGLNWLKLTPGTYTVSFGGYPNLIPPAPQVVTITAGAVTNVQGDYTGGMLRAYSNPAVPGTVFVDGIPRDAWGLNWLPLSVGTHTVIFGDVAGQIAPARQTVTINSGAVTEVIGNY